MSVEKRIYEIVTPSLRDMGYDVVRIRYSGDRRPVLQIMADRLDETMIDVDDCADISRTVSALLDVEDPIDEAYNLEVSSPGIDRPLTRLRDFERFAGFEAKVELDRAVDGRRRFRGRLKGVDGETITIETETGPASFAFPAIRQAKLVMTDELLEWSRQQAEASAHPDRSVDDTAEG